MIEKIRTSMGQIEALLTDAVARIAPWAAPIPTAYLVGRATVKHLNWPQIIGIVAAAIVESLGLATTSTALELREYNKSKRKSDPLAPYNLALVLVFIYFIVATILTVLLDIVPRLATYAPAIFPLLSLCGMTVLALRYDHGRRKNAIIAEKEKRKADRQRGYQTRPQRAVSDLTQEPSNHVKTYANFDALQASRLAKKDARLDALLTFYVDNPEAGPTEAARAIGVTRQTIYNYNDELEEAGLIKRDDSHIEVLKISN